MQADCTQIDIGSAHYFQTSLYTGGLAESTARWFHMSILVAKSLCVVPREE